MKTVGTKLDNSEYDIFEFCCNEMGLTKSEQLRKLIKNFVNEEPKHPKQSEPSQPLKFVDVPKSKKPLKYVQIPKHP